MGGKKAAAKDAKASKAASGSMAQHEDIVTVDFFVPDQEEQTEDLDVRGEQMCMSPHTSPSLQQSVLGVNGAAVQ